VTAPYDAIAAAAQSARLNYNTGLPAGARGPDERYWSDAVLVHRSSAAASRHRTSIFLARDLGDQSLSCKHQRGDGGSVLECCHASLLPGREYRRKSYRCIPPPRR
jgi:hypothetical protein